MGIYWQAIDFTYKQILYPHRTESVKIPGIYHYLNVFSHVVIMMNCHGSKFEMFSDMGSAYDIAIENQFEDITAKAYADFFNEYPEAHDFYEGQYREEHH